jgi:outer membrane biosynthesis protein TonB
MDKIFNWILLGSLLLHAAIGLLVMTVEPPPPPTQEHYATWVKKVTPVKAEEPKAPKPEPEAPVKKPKPEEILEEEPLPPSKEPRNLPKTKGTPRGGPAAGKPSEARRAGLRQQLSGAGLLATIGTASDEGNLANVFESGAVVGKDLGAALSERGGVRVTGGTRIGRKGALGAGHGADIGEVNAGAGGSAGAIGGKAGVAPTAFVKSSEAIIKKGGIDEKGVRMALKRRERGIQQCYERALKTNAKLKGKVMLEWNIDESGRVVSISVLQNTLGDKNVGDCISDIISRIRFPGAEKGLVPVRKTFVFESGA